MTEEHNGSDWSMEAGWWARLEALRVGHEGLDDVGTYRQLITGLLRFKYYADQFDAQYRILQTGGHNPEDRAAYLTPALLWFEPAARWSFLQEQIANPRLGTLWSEAVRSVERANPRFDDGFGVHLGPALASSSVRWLAAMTDFFGTISFINPRQFQRTMRYVLAQCEVLFQLNRCSSKPSLATEEDAMDDECLPHWSEVVNLDNEQHFLDRFYEAWTKEPSYLRYHKEDGALPYDPPYTRWQIALIGSRERWWFEVTDSRPRHTGASRGRPYRVDPIGSRLFGSTVAFLVRATAVTDRTSLIRIAADRIFSAMLSGEFGQDAAQFQYVRDPGTVPTIVYLDKD